MEGGESGERCMQPCWEVLSRADRRAGRAVERDELVKRSGTDITVDRTVVEVLSCDVWTVE